MRINNRKIGLILLFLCFCRCIVGCHAETEEKVEITIIHGWGSSEFGHESMREIYKEFEKEHPDIHLKLIAMPSSTDVIHKVSGMLTVGEIPDVIFTGGDGRESIYSFMSTEGYALDLKPYIEADPEFAKNISEIILKDWVTSDGKLYTVSDVLLMGGYWYNRDIFEKAGIDEPPKTWEEWVEVCKKIEKLDETIAPIVLDSEHISYLMTAILANENMEGLKQGRVFQIPKDSKEFDKMLSKLSEISQYSTLAETYNYRDTLLAFNKGESAIYINGVWANSMIDSELSVAYAPFPSDNGEGIGTLSACVGYILGNTGDDKRMKASVEFLKYMLSEPVAEKILEQTGQLPSNPKIEVTEQKSNARMAQAVHSIKSAGILIPTPENVWDLSEKETFGKNAILYLKNKINEEELRKRLLEP